MYKGSAKVVVVVVVDCAFSLSPSPRRCRKSKMNLGWKNLIWSNQNWPVTLYCQIWQKHKHAWLLMSICDGSKWYCVSWGVACERQTFLLAHRHWGAFREEERLRLNNRNSIPMTQNLSRIRSEALIGWRSSFIVLAIVYEWQTKDKKLQRSNVNAMNF